jgi:hypothetical protein
VQTDLERIEIIEAEVRRQLGRGEAVTLDGLKKYYGFDADSSPEEIATQQKMLGILDECGEEIIAAMKKPARKPARAKGQPTKAKRTKPLNDPLRTLAPWYPAYRISKHGVVWGPRGMVAVSWFRYIPYVTLYDATGRRRKRAIYWLMIRVGWVKDWRTGEATSPMGDVDTQ